MPQRDRAAVTVRRAEPDDYRAVRDTLAGPRALRGTLQVPFPSLETWRRRLAEPRDDFALLVACVGEEGEVVGNLGLHTFPTVPGRRHVAKLGMAVRDDWQGRGVGGALMEAALDLCDRWLNVVRLELEVFADNEAAVRLYRSAGFEIEGTLRAYAYRDGGYVDAYLMARLRPGFAHEPTAS